MGLHRSNQTDERIILKTFFKIGYKVCASSPSRAFPGITPLSPSFLSGHGNACSNLTRVSACVPSHGRLYPGHGVTVRVDDVHTGRRATLPLFGPVAARVSLRRVPASQRVVTVADEQLLAAVLCPRRRLLRQRKGRQGAGHRGGVLRPSIVGQQAAVQLPARRGLTQVLSAAAAAGRRRDVMVPLVVERGLIIGRAQREAPTGDLEAQEDGAADDDHQRRPEHDVNHFRLAVHLVRDHAARVGRVVEAGERAGLPPPVVGVAAHRRLVVGRSLQADAEGALQHTASMYRRTATHGHTVQKQCSARTLTDHYNIRRQRKGPLQRTDSE